MRFRPRSHPYGSLAMAEQESDDVALSAGGGSSLNRLLLGGSGSRRLLPHRCSGESTDDAAAAVDGENIGVNDGIGNGKSGEEERDDANVVILSYRLWQSHTGGDPDVLDVMRALPETCDRGVTALERGMQSERGRRGRHAR